jgi:hypothetical protein
MAMPLEESRQDRLEHKRQTGIPDFESRSDELEPLGHVEKRPIESRLEFGRLRVESNLGLSQV